MSMSPHGPRRTYLAYEPATDRASNFGDASTPKFSNDIQHLLAVCRANDGRGFPVAAIEYPK
jgi:hypothetical protein